MNTSSWVIAVPRPYIAHIVSLVVSVVYVLSIIGVSSTLLSASGGPYVAFLAVVLVFLAMGTPMRLKGAVPMFLSLLANLVYIVAALILVKLAVDNDTISTTQHYFTLVFTSIYFAGILTSIDINMGRELKEEWD